MIIIKLRIISNLFSNFILVITFNMSLKEQNYPILKANYDKFVNAKKSKNIKNNNKINDFYVREFETKVNTVSNTEQGKISVSKIKNDKKNDHKKIMSNIYIIPLAFLIYSYIYVKYYNQRIIVENRSENKLNFEIFTKFFFSHENPVIKKVNVFFHKKYKELDEKNNNGANNNNVNNSELVNNIKSSKKETIDFLKFIIIKIEEENNDNELAILEEIIEKINGSIENIKDICTKFNEVISNKYDNNDIIKKLININSNIDDSKLLDKSFKEEIFNINNTLGTPLNISILNKLTKINNVYEKLLEKINFINENVFKIKDIIDINFISEDDISILKLFYIFREYKTKYDNFKKNNNKNKVDIQLLKDIIVKLEDHIEIYDELSRQNLNNKNIDIYFHEYLKASNEIINKLLKYKDSSYVYKNELNFNNLNKYIVNNNNSKLKQCKFKDLTFLFVFSYLINNMIEVNYFYKKYNKSSKDIVKNVKDIKLLKTLFSTKFREFKKNSSDKYDEYIKYLKNNKKLIIKKLEKIDLEKNEVNNTSNNNNKKSIGKLESEYEEIKIKLTTLEATINSLEEEKTNNEKLTYIKDINTILDGKVNEIRDIFKKYLFKQTNLNSMKTIEQNKSRIENEIKLIKEKLKKLQDGIESKNSKFKELDNKVKKTVAELSIYEKKMLDKENEINIKILEIYSGLSSAAYATAKNELDNLKKEKNKISDNIDAKNKELSSLIIDRDSKKQEFDDNNSKINDYTTTLNKLDSNLKNIQKKYINIPTNSVNNIKSNNSFNTNSNNINSLYSKFENSISIKDKRDKAIKKLNDDITDKVKSILRNSNNIDKYNILNQEYKTLSTNSSERNMFFQIKTIFKYYNENIKRIESLKTNEVTKKTELDIKKNNLYKIIFFKKIKTESINRQKSELNRLSFNIRY